ncbi:carbohydrate-binding domain-containing protein [Schaalia cardiffensis]
MRHPLRKRASAKPLKLGSLAFLASIALAGCSATNALDSLDNTLGSSQSASEGTPASHTAAPPSAAQALAENVAASHVGDDEWDVAKAQTITLHTSTATSDAEGVSIKDSSVTITQAGVYRLSGQLKGQVIIDAPKDADVILIVDNASIENESGAAIWAHSADNVVISLEGNSTVSDASSYEDSAEANAAIYADCDLTITGEGTLKVTGRGNDAITSTDDLYILSGTLMLTAVDDGLRGKDSLTIAGGTISVEAGGDGLKADQDADTNSGYITIQGGEVSITSGGDGIDAHTDVILTGGSIDVKAGGGASSGANATTSTKGVKAGVYLISEDASLNIDSADDGLHSNGALRLSSGTITVASGDDGAHAEVAALLDGADLAVSQSNEGLEAGLITISGGTVDLVATDDGVNASGSTSVEEGVAAVQESSSSTENSQTPTKDPRAGKPGQGAAPEGATPSEGATLPEGAPNGGFGAAAPPNPGDKSGDSKGQGAPGAGGGGEFEDTGEQLNITGGTLTVNAGGDGIDSNGSITISGGNTTIYGPENGANGALDYNGTMTLSGGTLLAIGTSDMAQAPSSTQGQGWVSSTVSGSAGSTITISDAQGVVLASYTSPKAFTSMVFSSAEMTAGAQYTLSIDGVSTSVTAGEPAAGQRGGGQMPGPRG